MKGIIAEIHNNDMIVITKQGDFIKCKKLPNCQVGNEVNIPKTSMTTIYKRLSAMAASFIILAMLSTGVYAYYTPYSYISMDINPSLELYVNRFDRVIGAHAFNEDAKKVIESAKGIQNKNVDTALESLLKSAADGGYLKEDAENSVMFVVSSNNTKEEAALTDIVSKTSTEVLAGISKDYEVILETTQVETYKKAKEQNVSPGKVILADKFKEVKPELDEEKIKQMPLQQAIKQIEKKEDKDDKQQETPATVKKSNDKLKSNGNVMNVKELIKEKNEELGEKLDEGKKNEKDIEKNNANDNESFNQNQQQDKSQKDIDKEAGKEQNNETVTGPKKPDAANDKESLNQNDQQDKEEKSTKENRTKNKSD